MRGKILAQVEPDGVRISVIWRRVIGTAFVLPWVVTEVVLQGQSPALGYAAGLICGSLTIALWSERPPKLWVMALIGFTLAIAHVTLARHY